MGYQWNTSYWGQYGSTYTLAGVIQGEASTPEGQFGVASVMQNRMDGIGGGYVGAGSGSIQSVVTPSQFNGWQTPTPQSMAYAEALQNGTLSSYGNTGNATFYAAPSTSNASWANPNTASGQGLFGAGNNQIGGNYYSDNLGPPTSGFQAPQYGANNPTYLQDQQQNLNDYGYSPGQTYAAGNGAAAAGSTYDPYSSKGFGDALNNSQDASQNYNDYGYSGSTGAGGATGTIAPAGTTPQEGTYSIQPGLPSGNGGQGGVGGYDPSINMNPDGTYKDNLDLGTIDVPQTGNAGAGAGSAANGAPMGETPGYDGMTASQSQDQMQDLQDYGYSPAQSVAPYQQATPDAQAGTNSSAYAGDMDVAPAIDTLARSVAASAQSQNTATASAANTVSQGLSGVGSSIQQGAQQTSSATNSLAQTVAGSTGSFESTLQALEVGAFSFTSNIFIRAAVIILGLIFVAAALHMFGATQNTIVDPVSVGRRVGKVAGKVAVAA